MSVVFVVNRYKCFMENKNIITFCSCKSSQISNIEAHENLLTAMKKA